MNPVPPPDDLNEELMTRWIDGQLTTGELAAVERALAAEPLLASEKEGAGKLSSLLRHHLPARLEPGSPEFFTSRIMEEIQGSPVMHNPAPTPSPGGFMSWLQRPWFAPLASAAAVALIFLAASGQRPGPASPDVARVYAPDPNVVARSYYSESAEATVIDLKGLEAVPDEREIRAFDVADAGPAVPGQPQVLHAANDPERALMVVAPGTSGGPRIRELH